MGILLRGGALVFRDAVIEADILVENGKIAKVGKSIDSGYSRTVDLRGRLILPGAVDPHIHGREPGLEYKDDFYHTTRAAVLGGVTTVLDMPNTVPPVDSPSRLLEKKFLLSRKSHTDFALYAVLYDYSSDLETNIVELVRSGAIGFKAFMAQTTGNLPPPSFKTIYTALELSQKLGFTVVFHAEDRECVEFFTSRVLASGGDSLRAHSDSRPPLCERLSIEHIVSIAEAVGGRAYIAHLSTASALKTIKRPRRSPTEIYVEVTPTYLFFDYEKHGNLGALVKVNPPVRDSRNRMKLWRAISRGLVDVVATDHAPHAEHEKKVEFSKAAAGVASIQHLVPLMLTSALEGAIPIGRVVELCSENPAKIFGLYPVKGSLLPGSDADIIAVDPSAEYVVSEETLEYKNKLTPYVGWKLKGKIDKVFLRGELVVDRGTIVVDRPSGKPLGREAKR
ncbi:MAG: dihydroorotase family protein [Sulfolobales archaeon]|nr:dihydroorotase family protein [Sulfolobales archaeon]MDW8082339.1 dihydroorotase family protein [Sulfolobales archaeon]